MHTTRFLSGLSASMAALLLSAGTAGAATLTFTRDCDPIAVDPVSSTKPAVEPWYITFEQRGASGACVLADIFTNSSLSNKLAVGDKIRTLSFSGYDIDFLEAGRSSRPLLASLSTIDDGYILADGSSAISARLGNGSGSDKFNVLAFRFQLGTESEIRTTVTFRSGASTTLEAIAGTGSFFQSRFFSFGDERIEQVDWQLSGALSDMRLDTLTFSTTVTDPGGGGGGGGDGGDGGGNVPEPSSLALLAVAGGLAAVRRRHRDG